MAKRLSRPNMSKYAMIAGLFLSLAALSSAAQDDENLAPQSIYCIETTTGTVLHQENIDTVRPPASMLKLMMMLLVSEGLNNGTLQLNQEITVTAQAEGMGGTQVFLKAGERFTLEKLAEALAVASANDAAMALAEGIWGSKADCLKAMNSRARQLGMNNTTYHSVHGLPPAAGEPFDQTTARDHMLLAMECLKHPRIREWVNTKTLEFRPGQAAKNNTNKLLWRMQDCDGMKTGYIRAAGFCITASAERNGVRLLCVVMGSPSKYGRFNLAEEIMEQGFQKITRVQVAKAGGPAPHDTYIENGEPELIYLRAKEELSFIASRDDLPNIRLVYEVDDPIVAPLGEGQVVGTLTAELNGRKLGSTPLEAPFDVKNTGWKLVLRNGLAMWIGLDSLLDSSDLVLN